MQNDKDCLILLLNSNHNRLLSGMGVWQWYDAQNLPTGRYALVLHTYDWVSSASSLLRFLQAKRVLTPTVLEAVRACYG